MTSLVFNSHIFVLIILLTLSLLFLVPARPSYAPSRAAGMVPPGVPRPAKALAIVTGLALALFVGIYTPEVHAWFESRTLQVSAIGFSVGVVELVARYRENPWHALKAWPAWLYIATNVAACVVALRMIHVIRPDWIFVTYAARPALLQLYLVLTAGFGAVALFRSSLFKLRTEQGELQVGPSVVLDTLLSASDRAVDRVLAAPRGDRVAEIMGQVSFAKAKAALPAHCFAMMQNVSQQEQQDVGSEVAKLATADMDDRMRSFNLGLRLLNVVGDKVLRHAVANLGGTIRADLPPPDGDVAGIAAVMRNVDPAKARDPLPKLCYDLCAGSSVLGTETREDFIANVAGAPGTADPRDAFGLGLVLARRVGLSTLEVAVRRLGTAIARDSIVIEGIDPGVARTADLMRGISFDKAVIPLPACCAALTPGITDARIKTLTERLTDIRSQNVSPKLKSLMLGLALRDVFSDPVLAAALDQLGDDIVV